MVVEKTQFTINGSNGMNARIAIHVKQGEIVASFKYIDATLYGEGSKPEVLSRVAQTYYGETTRLYKAVVELDTSCSCQARVGERPVNRWLGTHYD